MPLSNKNNKVISTKQANRIRYYINLLIDCSKNKKVFSNSDKKWYKFKVNLITLTLPSLQCHTDLEIHNKIFKEFIRAWKRQSKELLYIYKAEVQDNGNLHYHLTTNTYIHHKELRNQWNYYCNKLGYCDRSRTDNPNSTDVHSVKDIDKLAGYMVKYLSKKDMYTKSLKRYHNIYDKHLNKIKGPVCVLPKNYLSSIKRKVEIKVWDCSRPLMIGKCSIDIDNDQLMNEVRLCASNSNEIVQKDWFLFVPIDASTRKLLPAISKEYNNHLSKLRKFVSNQPSEYYI